MTVSGRYIKKKEAANALATVAPEKAFYFYREVGQPIGAVSRSLGEFAIMVKSIEPSSIKFHVERGDFERWFRMLGDQSLASQVAALRGRNISSIELRGKLSSMVRTRVDQLSGIAGSK